MKRLLIAFAFVLCLTGCEKLPLLGGMIIDWYPVVFDIQVVDANGKDLLDPSNDNSWLLGTTISFMDKKDTLDQACLDNIHQTRAYLPYYDGVKLMSSTRVLPNWFLNFGEFDGADSYDNEKLTITWPDGKVNIITYTRKFNMFKTDVSKKVYKLDGVKCSNPIKIVR